MHVPNYNDAIMKSSINTVIFMRIISPFVIKTPWGLEHFLAFPLLLLSVRVALRLRPSLLPTSSHTATVCVLCLYGKDAFSCSTWHRWFHKHFPTSFWHSEKWRQSLQLRQEEYRDCSSFGVQLEVGVDEQPNK